MTKINALVLSLVFTISLAANSSLLATLLLCRWRLLSIRYIDRRLVCDAGNLANCRNTVTRLACIRRCICTRS